MIVYALDVGTQIQRATAQVARSGQVVPIELEDDAGEIVYSAPSRIRHIARIFRAGACVQHAYSAEPVNQ